MAKTPVLGQCKTRLAKSVGDEKALEYYNLMLKKTLKNVHQVQAEPIIHFSESNPFTQEFSDFEKDYQVKGDLGIKMKSAFSKSFQNGSKKVLVIGTDCPDNSAMNMNLALDSLKEYDIVIGPSGDGGYYLLGMNSFHEDLFENIEWSSNSVFDKTCQIAENKGLRVKILPEINDLDHYSDLKNSPYFINLTIKGIIEL